MKRKFSVGDRVRRTSGRAKGKVGRVIGYDDDLYCVEFDEYIHGHSGYGLGKEGHCWNCCEEYLELENPCKVIFKGNETILIKDGKEYVSKCADGDKYDKEKGVLLCLAKASGVSYTDLQKMIDTAEYELDDATKKAIDKIAERLKIFCEAGFKALKDNDKAKPEAENTVKEVIRPAEKGEYIKIVNGLQCEKYRNGDIFKVIEPALIGDVHAELPDGETYGNTGGAWNYINANEYVVLENYKPYKITLSEFWKSKKELGISCKNDEQMTQVCDIMREKGFYNKNAPKLCNDGFRKVLNNKNCRYTDINKSILSYNCETYEFNEVDLNN